MKVIFLKGFHSCDYFIIHVTSYDVWYLLLAIQSFIEPKVVLIGSSFIGMECAAMLSKSVKSLTVIGMEKVKRNPFVR